MVKRLGRRVPPEASIEKLLLDSTGEPFSVADVCRTLSTNKQAKEQEDRRFIRQRTKKILAIGES
jgi:hypothetical protein